MTDVDLSGIHSELRQLRNSTIQLNANIGAVDNKVAQVGAVQQQTRGELKQLSDAFNGYVLRAERTANIQRAETRVGVLEARIDHDFGHYETVRRTAAGLLRAFDSGLVKQETVENVTETLMIENSGYWLAPSTVALGAWSGGDPVLCDQAIAIAYKLAPSRTALMFALLLRRQDRQQSSVRWLRHYLRNLDPSALSREFAVVLEAIAQGAFGAGGRELIHETVEDWRRVLADDQEAQDAQVKRWRFEVERYMPAGAGESFPRLKGHSPQWPALELVLRGAETHQPFIDRYKALLDAEYTPSDRVEDSIDDILDILVDEYDAEELPLRRDLALEQAIIEHEGDKEAAKAVVDAGSAALGDTLDFLTVQSSAALDPAAIGVTPATQQVALADCAEWVERAHGSFCAAYRSRFPADVEVAFQEQQPFGKQVFTLPTWKGSLTKTAMPKLEQSLAAHWDASSAPLLDALTFRMGRALVAPGIVSGVLLLLFIAVNPVVAILLAGAMFGIWYLVINGRRAKAEAYRKQVADALEALKKQALLDLRGAGTEYVDFQSRYREADAKEPRVRTLIASFAEAGHDKTPHEGRTLLDGGIHA